MKSNERQRGSMDDYKEKRKKPINLSNCLKCRKRAVRTTQRTRKNYPFGKKSRPLRSAGKRIKKCSSCGWREEKER